MRHPASLVLVLLLQAGAAFGAVERSSASADRIAGESARTNYPAHFLAAEHWYERWLDACTGAAERLAGRFFERAVGDDARAGVWYRSAAWHGDAEAQYRLGLMYAQGRGGLERDPAQASRLLHSAAETGHVDAQGGLGLSYLLGQGVDQNFKYAYMWVRLASEVKGGKSVRTKELIAHAMPVDRLPEADELARRCKLAHFHGCDDDVWRR